MKNAHKSCSYVGFQNYFGGAKTKIAFLLVNLRGILELNINRSEPNLQLQSGSSSVTKSFSAQHINTLPPVFQKKNVPKDGTAKNVNNSGLGSCSKNIQSSSNFGYRNVAFVLNFSYSYATQGAIDVNRIFLIFIVKLASFQVCHGGSALSKNS